MDLNKRFLHFKTKDNFESQKNSLGIQSIAFIQDSKEIWTHGTIYGTKCKFTLDSEADEDGKKYLRLTSDRGEDLGKVDIASFVKDGMVNTVAFDDESKKLTITFNTDAGKEPVEIDLSSLVDIYDGSKLKLKEVAVPETYSAPAAGDSVDVAVANLMKKDADLATAISTAKSELEEALDNLADNVAAAAYAGIENGTDGDFVTTTITEKDENNKQKVSVSVNAIKISEVKSATEENGPVDGLAIASDIKDYFAWEELD